MIYDRLTRMVKINVDGAEYALSLTIGMLEELEDELPNGRALVDMILNRETPKIKVVRKAFCLGLHKKGVLLDEDAAEKVFEKYCEETGMQNAVSLYYVLIAASNILGTETSNMILSGLGLIVKDKEEDKEEKAEEDEKNA